MTDVHVTWEEEKAIFYVGIDRYESLKAALAYSSPSEREALIRISASCMSALNEVTEEYFEARCDIEPSWADSGGFTCAYLYGDTLLTACYVTGHSSDYGGVDHCEVDVPLEHLWNDALKNLRREAEAAKLKEEHAKILKEQEQAYRREIQERAEFERLSRKFGKGSGDL